MRAMRPKMEKLRPLITSSLHYGYVTLTISTFVFFGRTLTTDYDYVPGRTYRLSMSMLDDGPIPAMEGVLPSVIDPD
jgi:hypothetical protein